MLIYNEGVRMFSFHGESS